jgi:hypothetical protein
MRRELAISTLRTNCLLLKPFRQHPMYVTSFRLSKSCYSLSFLFKRANKYGSVFPYALERVIYETKFPTHVSFLCSILYLSHHF